MAEPINDGGPAFPVERGRLNQATGEFVEVESEWGLSRRDYFAAKALQGWLASYGERPWPEAEAQQRIARNMYTLADAMLAASKEPRHG